MGWCGLKEIEGETDLVYRFKQDYWEKGMLPKQPGPCFGIKHKIPNIMGRPAIENKAFVRVLEKIGLTFFEYFVYPDSAGVPSVKYILPESYNGYRS